MKKTTKKLIDDLHCQINVLESENLRLSNQLEFTINQLNNTIEHLHFLIDENSKLHGYNKINPPKSFILKIV